MTTFQVGQTYKTRSIGDHNCIFSLTVASRTAKTLTTTEGKRLKIHDWQGVEYVKPEGSYSMSPSIRADGPSVLLADWEQGGLDEEPERRMRKKNEDHEAAREGH